MRVIESIVKRLGPELNSLEIFLKKQVDSFEKPLQPLVSYCLEVKGKRLRPIVLFLCAGESCDSEATTKAAAIVELVHIATLVHDDILDEAHTRHSRPTLAKNYGPESAVLLGDALFAHALELSASYPSPWVCGAVARAVRRVCAGEIQQTLGAGACTIEEYQQVVALKTGELFQLSAQLGAFFAKATEDVFSAFSQFGLFLGSAYQMLDDILDVWGQESELGKTLGTDALTGKKNASFSDRRGEAIFRRPAFSSEFGRVFK